jgi:hypothetical protein
MSRRHLRSLALAALVLAGAACDGGTYYYDPYAYDSYYYYGYDTGYYYGYYDPFYYTYYRDTLQAPADPATPDTLAAQVAMSAPSYYSPASCVNATSSGGTATLVLSKCTSGPLGLPGVSGTLTATFATADNGISVTTSSSNLVIDGHAATFNGTGTSTSTATSRTFTGTSSGTFVGTTGDTYTRNSQINFDWVPGSGCATINGSGSVTGNGQSFTTMLANLQKCRDQCPTAGTLTLNAPDRVITVTFDGTATAQLAASTTSSKGTLALKCTPAK